MIDQPKIWDTLRCIERALKAVTASTLFTYIEIQHFQKTSTLIHKLVEDENNGIINVWFSYFEPNTKLGLHVNNDPYMYRAHLGLIVPDGNIGFKVCDDIVKWKEGEILVFDPTNPHTAWNLTEEPRIVLIVDFLKPEKDREEMKRLEREQFEKIMKENPSSLGMSGGYFELNEEIKKKYAISWIG